jgi:hypothetical protein
MTSFAVESPAYAGMTSMRSPTYAGMTANV